MTEMAVAGQAGWVADDSTFGARLALVRQRMSWGNVKEAADACGLPVENWRRWERDGRAPRDIVEIAGIISERTGCDFGWLLAGRRLSGYQRNAATLRYGYRPAPMGPTDQPSEVELSGRARSPRGAVTNSRPAILRRPNAA